VLVYRHSQLVFMQKTGKESSLKQIDHQMYVAKIYDKHNFHKTHSLTEIRYSSKYINYTFSM